MLPYILFLRQDAFNFGCMDNCVLKFVCSATQNFLKILSEDDQE